MDLRPGLVRVIFGRRFPRTTAAARSPATHRRIVEPGARIKGAVPARRAARGEIATAAWSSVPPRAVARPSQGPTVRTPELRGHVPPAKNRVDESLTTLCVPDFTALVLRLEIDLAREDPADYHFQLKFGAVSLHAHSVSPLRRSVSPTRVLSNQTCVRGTAGVLERWCLDSDMVGDPRPACTATTGVVAVEALSPHAARCQAWTWACIASISALPGA